MDNIDVDLCDTNETDELSAKTESTLVSFKKQNHGNMAEEQSNFKIVAVQSLAGHENIAHNFLSEMNSELRVPREKRPKLKIVPIASLKSPVIVNPVENKLIESATDEDVNDDEDGIQIKRIHLDKLNQSSSTSNSKLKSYIESKSVVTDENESGVRPSGSSRRKSRITTRNADFDEPSVINNVIVNAVREEQIQKERELPHGSKTELELMRNVAFLRVCVNHILTKIGRRPITYDRNNQTLASLIQKYSKS